MRRLAAALLALACSTCADEIIAPAPFSLSLERGDYAVVFDVQGVTLTLSRGGEELTRLDGAGLALGVVDEIVPTASYDPWIPLTDPEHVLVPAGLTFAAAERATLLERSADAFAVELTHSGGLTSRLDVAVDAEGRFRASFVPLDPSRVAYLRLGVAVAPDEAFYGLGESFDDVNQRGKMRAMQLEPAALESGYNEAHVPVPLLIGTRGWGLFVASSRAGVFDVAKTDPDRASCVFGMGEQAAEGLAFHLFGAARPIEITRHYYDVTGYPRLPAPWALGPLVWRDENDDQAQVESDLDIMRELDLATSGIWIDRPYATGVQTFDFDAVKFPDPTAMIDKAHHLGFRVSLWHAPYLDESDPATAALRQEAKANGYYPEQTGLNLNSWGKIIDFTSPASKAWWQEHLRAYTALGVEGFKLDYAEDVVPDGFGARNVFRFRDGSDERTMHRGYTLAYHATYAELLPPEGGLLLCRAGKWGDQVHGPIIWPGDLDARMWRHGEEVTEGGETFRAVGGLHASIVGGVSLGPSGFPFYGADTGGYRHSPPDVETFRRWFEQTALSSVMQIGTSSNDVAWEFGDAALLASYREYTRLHARLFPYLWTLAHEMLETGVPLQRPFGLAEPALGVHPSDQYFLGDALLVAPVTERGAVSREVVFPSGTWHRYWDGAKVEGPTTITVDAPLGELPLFVKAGSPVPMLRDTVDTLAPATDPAVDSFADDPGLLWVRLVPGQEQHLALYDGAKVSHASDAAAARVSVSPGSVFDGGFVAELFAWGELGPSVVLVDGIEVPALTSRDALRGAAAGYLFEPASAGGTVFVAAAGAGTVEVRR